MQAFGTVLAAILLADAGAGGDAMFVQKPTAARDGDTVTIRFAVSAPTDAEVAVLDATGAVVRHLAAGRLGDAPPRPFAKGLAQTLAWDGKDDDGKAAAGKPFSVRVRLGLTAAFDRIIGWSGQRIDAPQAMACGPDGTLYVVHGESFYGHRQTTLVTAFDREGRYLRQVYPGPGGLPKEKRAGWPHLALGGGGEAPVIHHVLTRSLYPGAYLGAPGKDLGNLAATGDGRLVIVCGPATTLSSLIKYADVREGRRVLILGADGGAPENFLGPVVAGLKTGGRGYVAVSPDSRYAYVSGMGATNISGVRKPAEIHHVVYRMPLDGAGKAEQFIGTLRKPGGGKTGLNDPRGVAVDGEGNVYVADHGNKRIAAFKPDGSYLGEIPAEGATRIMVSRKTGAVYARVGPALVKYGGLKDPAKNAEVALPRINKDPRHSYCFALDDSGDAPVLWMSTTRWVLHRLVRLVDRGDRFEATGDPIGARVRKDNPGLPFIMNVAPLGEKVVTCTPSFPRASTTARTYDLATGAYKGAFLLKAADGNREKRNALFFCGSEYTAGKDGRLYTQTGGFMWPAKNQANPGTVRRYDAEGYPEPFEKLGKHFIHKYYHGHYRPAGMFVTRTGRIYLAAFPGYRGRDQKEKGLKVTVIAPDGSVEDERRVFIQGATVGGIAVDREGAIYVGVQMWPKGKRLAERFTGKLPKSSPIGHPRRMYEQQGMLVKFPPAGGRIVADPDGPWMGHAGGYAKVGRKNEPVPVRIEGALWTRRLGFIPINATNEAGCQCENTRFDVDEFGRVYIPDLYGFRIVVLDPAGNTVTRFGAYGNMDNRGPTSPHPTPAIPLGWPIAARLAGNRCLIADLTNRRIVAAGFRYGVEETCEVK